MPEKELVQIVDSNNTEIGLTTRQEMRAKRLPHRATYILVFNSNGEIFIQKRTKNKDIYPGYYDIASGGVVLGGESYEMSASRELHEELGIKDTPLVPHFDIYHEDGNNIVWVVFFPVSMTARLAFRRKRWKRAFFIISQKFLNYLNKNHLLRMVWLP